MVAAEAAAVDVIDVREVGGRSGGREQELEGRLVQREHLEQDRKTCRGYRCQLSGLCHLAIVPKNLRRSCPYYSELLSASLLRLLDGNIVDNLFHPFYFRI